MPENGVQHVVAVGKDVSRYLDAFAVMVRLIGNRPQSISGWTFSITTRRGNASFTKESHPGRCCAGDFIAGGFPARDGWSRPAGVEFSRHSLVNRLPPKTCFSIHAAAKIMIYSAILEIYHMPYRSVRRRNPQLDMVTQMR